MVFNRLLAREQSSLNCSSQQSGIEQVYGKEQQQMELLRHEPLHSRWRAKISQHVRAQGLPRRDPQLTRSNGREFLRTDLLDRLPPLRGAGPHSAANRPGRQADCVPQPEETLPRRALPPHSCTLRILVPLCRGPWPQRRHRCNQTSMALRANNRLEAHGPRHDRRWYHRRPRLRTRPAPQPRRPSRPLRRPSHPHPTLARAREFRNNRDIS